MVITAPSAAIPSVLLKYGRDANRHRVLMGRKGELRVELFGVETCRHCGGECLGANWPTIVDVPAGNMTLIRASLATMPECIETTTDPDSIVESAPEDYCATCYTDLELEF